jgi:hypothetical protein
MARFPGPATAAGKAVGPHVWPGPNPWSAPRDLQNQRTRGERSAEPQRWNGLPARLPFPPTATGRMPVPPAPLHNRSRHASTTLITCSGAAASDVAASRQSAAELFSPVSAHLEWAVHPSLHRILQPDLNVCHPGSADRLSAYSLLQFGSAQRGRSLIQPCRAHRAGEGSKRTRTSIRVNLT